MNDISRAELAGQRAEIDRDARSERWVTVQGIVALLVVAAVVLVRELVVR